MIPTIGFGTAACQDADSMFNAIMKVGYVHIDTAHVYQNEQVVGDVLQRCFKAGKKREELHVATKIAHSQYNDVEGALKS
jgi:diketogulonate reductase-like aldo/keto reductase